MKRDHFMIAEEHLMHWKKQEYASDKEKHGHRFFLSQNANIAEKYEMLPVNSNHGSKNEKNQTIQNNVQAEDKNFRYSFLVAWKSFIRTVTVLLQ